MTAPTRTPDLHPGAGPALLRAALAAALVLLGLDLLWLGVVARGFYARSLGPLARGDVLWPAALAFYAVYLGAILVHAVRGAPGVGAAARRGAGLGLVVYAAYELTNWAVLRGWPAALVPVDIAWGVVLTATSAAAGRLAWGHRPTPPGADP